MKVQRLRFRYALGAQACGLTQRELVTAWEEACAGGGLNVARTEGKRTSTLISIAAPLPRGVTSESELVDVFLAEAIPPRESASRVASHLPPGIEPISVEEIGVNAPSLQSQLRWAEYEVHAEGIDAAVVQQRINAMLDAATLPSQYRRENKTREYDMRPLIIDLRLLAGGPGAAVVMRLRAEPERTARADEVASALGLPEDRRIHRTRLALDELPPVLSACRRASERDEG